MPIRPVCTSAPALIGEDPEKTARTPAKECLQTPLGKLTHKPAVAHERAPEALGSFMAELSALPAQPATPTIEANVAAQAYAAQTLAEMGAILDRLSLVADDAPNAVASIAKRFGALSGTRPGSIDEQPKDVMVFAGREKSSFQTFSTGDPFTVLKESPRGKDVLVVQHGNSEQHDLPTLVMEALQIAHAARTHGAKSVRLVLPKQLDPSVYPDAMSRLVQQLAQATGVVEVRYELDDELGKTARDPVAYIKERAASVSSLAELLGVMKEAEQLAQGPNKRAIARAMLEAAETIEPIAAPRVQMNESNTVVFAGSSNPDLGKAIAGALDAELNAERVTGRDVVIVQGTREVVAKQSVSALFFEALLLGMKAQDQGAKNVRLVLPYQPSARSDKTEEGKGNYVGAYAKLMALWSEKMGFKDVTLVTPHDLHTPSYFMNGKTQVHVVDGLKLLTERIIKDVGADKLILATPDDGATKRTAGIAKELGLTVLKGQKTRAGHDDKATVEKLGDGSVDVSDKIAIVPDDEVGSGGTLKQAAAAIKAQGPKGVFVAIAHNNMVQDQDKRAAYFRSLKEIGVQGVYFLDTQPMGALPGDLDGFVHVVPVANAIAEKLQ